MVDLLIEVPYMGLNDGYGQSSPEVIWMLTQFCELHGLSWGVVPTKILSNMQERQEELSVIQRHTVSKNDIPKAKVLLRHNYPYEETYGADKVVTYTMFETDKCPALWVDTLNKSDLVIVPNPYLREVFSKAISTPVEVVYLPLRKEFYEKVDDADFISHLPKKFTASVVGTIDPADRKAIKAMVTYFSNIDLKMNLVIKTRGNLSTKDKRIKIINGFYSNKQLIQFYLASHVGVYPSKGEGYGLPQIETSILGRPVVMADNTGASWSSIMMPWSYLIPCEMKPADYKIKMLGDDVGNWGYVDFDTFFETVEELREMWEVNRDDYIDKMVLAHAKNLLTLQLAPHKIQEQLDTYLLPLFGE